MIRFLDKQVYSMLKGEYSRNDMILFFSKQENKNHIILLYTDAGEYYGMATVYTVFKNMGQDGVNTEKYVKPSSMESFWSDLKLFFVNTEYEYLPVFDTDGNLLYFAYEDERDYYKWLDSAVFFKLEERQEYLPLQEAFPWMQEVCIYDLNEFAFRFYKILEQRGIPCTVDGEKWEVLYPQIVQKNGGLTNAEKRLNVYAEGVYGFEAEDNHWGRTGYPKIDTWDFLLTFSHINKFYSIEQMKLQLREKKVAFYSAIFPELEDLDYYTAEEYYRDKEHVRPDYPVVDWENKLVREQMAKVGGYASREAWEHVRKSKTNTHFMVDGSGLYCKKYGEGIHTIYIIGSCIATGIAVSDEASIGAEILKEVREYADDYQVMCIAVSQYDFVTWEKVLNSLTLKEKDIIIYMDTDDKNASKYIDYHSDIDIRGILNERKTDWFWNGPIHTSQRGNHEIAKRIVQRYLLDEVRKKVTCPRCLQHGKTYFTNEMEAEICAYIEGVKENVNEKQTVGAIVMNCNPFTYGHRHLIEYAAKQVDFLYIFVVEEDRSFFKFEDRLWMVRQGTADLSNIVVVPSGKWVLSYETMPIYFEKARKQEAQVDASRDLEIFGRYIAPALSIRKRFVGDEPTDKVTRQYNEQMQEILGHFDVELDIIPRKEQNGMAISASKVRRHMQDGNWEAVKQLVPETTYEICLEYDRKVTYRG